MLTNGGKPIVPDISWEGTGIFQWPLPQDYSITSPFGYREDPITGQISFHSGTDIAAPDATPILAAADGIVVDANAIDPWGECPLSGCFCNGWTGGAAGGGHCPGRQHRKLYRQSSAF